MGEDRGAGNDQIAGEGKQNPVTKSENEKRAEQATAERGRARERDREVIKKRRQSP